MHYRVDGKEHVVALGVGDLVIGTDGNEVVGIAHVLATRMQCDVAVGRVDGVIPLAQPVADVGLHQDRLSGIGRIGILALDFAELPERRLERIAVQVGKGFIVKLGDLDIFLGGNGVRRHGGGRGGGGG